MNGTVSFAMTYASERRGGEGPKNTRGTAQDPVLGPAVMQGLRKAIRNCPEPIVLEQAGHFVQEHG